jgi:hypothetical protein
VIKKKIDEDEDIIEDNNENIDNNEEKDNGHWGPLFGYLSNNDLSINREGTWSSVTNSHSDINISRNFEVDEYKVFQVVKIIRIKFGSY